MTTDDIGTSCQQNRPQPAWPVLAGALECQAYIVGIICNAVCKRRVVTFNDTKVMSKDDIDTFCHWARTPTSPPDGCKNLKNIDGT